MADCVDLFAVNPKLADALDAVRRRGSISHERTNFAAESPLAILVRLVLSAAMHSMVVERAVSHAIIHVQHGTV